MTNYEFYDTFTGQCMVSGAALRDLTYEEWIADRYMVDLEWFNTKIHCRRPMYGTINFIEFFILNDKNDIIDSIKFTDDDEIYGTSGRYRIVNKEKYDLIKSYMKEK